MTDAHGFAPLSSPGVRGFSEPSECLLQGGIPLSRPRKIYLGDIMAKLTHWAWRLRIIPWMMILISAGQIAWWAADRTPPFEMIKYRPMVGQPGGLVIIEAEVKRDVARGCSVVGNRTMYDSKGTLFPLSDNKTVSAKALAVLQTIMPDRTAIAINIPIEAAPGKAKIVTTLNYTCNPVQRLFDWPIEALMINDLTIVP